MNNAELVAEIIVCQRTYIVSDRLALMLMLFVSHYARKSCWRSYSFNDEMQSDALCQLVKHNDVRDSNDLRPTVLKFDVEYAARKAALTGTTPLAPNGFAWVTQIVKNCFVRRIKLEQRQSDLRDDLLIKARKLPSMRRQMADEDNKSAEPIPKKPPRLKKPGPPKGYRRGPRAS